MQRCLIADLDVNALLSGAYERQFIQSQKRISQYLCHSLGCHSARRRDHRHDPAFAGVIFEGDGQDCGIDYDVRNPDIYESFHSFGDGQGRHDNADNGAFFRPYRAFQFGDGFTNMITPTSGVLMAVLGMARIPYGKWVKWVWKFILTLVIIGFLLLMPAVLYDLQGF